MTRRERQHPYQSDQANGETSFEERLHAAVDPLFTNHSIAERLAGNETLPALLRERKLAFMKRLGDLAREEVMGLWVELSQLQAREPLSPPAEARDPYDIAWDLVEAWKETLQQLGQVPRLSDLKNDEDFDDYHDELNSLYRQACRALRLPWPPPARNVA